MPRPFLLAGLFLTFVLYAGFAHAREPDYLTDVPDEATTMKVKVQDQPDAKVETLYAQSHALLIGQIGYKNWDELPAVRKEIDDLRDVLEKHRFKVEVHANLTSSELLVVINDFMRRRAIVPNSRIVTFVGGHGTQRKVLNRSFGYILPIDAPSEKTTAVAELSSYGLALDMFTAWAKSPDPTHMLFVFDACFSGSFYGRNDPSLPPEGVMSVSIRAPKVVPPKRGVELSDYIFQPGPRDRGRQFITAGGPDDTVPKDSIFTRLFIEALDGKRDALANFDHWLTGSELGTWLEQNTRSYYNGSETNRATPVFGTLDDGSFKNGNIVFARMDLEPEHRLVVDDPPFKPKRPEAATTPLPAAQKVAEAVQFEKLAKERAAAATSSQATLDDLMKSLGPVAAPVAPAFREAARDVEVAKTAQASYSRKAVALQEDAKIILGGDNAQFQTLIAVATKSASIVEPEAGSQLSREQETELQKTVDALSSNEVTIRRNARKILAKFLQEMPDGQARTTTSRLLQNLSKKSYRYQLGIAEALTEQPGTLKTKNRASAMFELEQAAKLIDEPSFSKAVTKAKSKL